MRLAGLRGAGLATAELRRLPDFLIIGAQRSGTTALYRHLAAHPGVRPAQKKEIRFFDVHYGRGPRWYRSHFPLSGPGRFLTGESTPAYLYHPHVPERVRLMLPEVRLLALLRDPVRRAHSAWRLMRRLGREPLGFEEALAAEEGRTAALRRRLEEDPSLHAPRLMHHAYLHRGIYAPQLERWMSRFPREQLLVVRSEDLFERPHAVLPGILAFLGLDPEPRPPDGFRPAHHVEGPAIDGALERELRAFYEPHNRLLSELLGWEQAW